MRVSRLQPRRSADHPGTGFNKDRNKVFFFTGYEFYKQRLDTGILQSWVPSDAMNGDFSNTSSFSGLNNSFVSTVPSNPARTDPASQIVERPGPVALRTRPGAGPAQTGATTTSRASSSTRTCSSG